MIKYKQQQKLHKEQIAQPISLAKEYVLTISQLVILESAIDHSQSEFYSFRVCDSLDHIIKESPIFNKSVCQSWSFKLNTDKIKFVLFREDPPDNADRLRSSLRTSSGLRRREQLGEALLSRKKNTQYIASRKSRNQIICTIKYQIKEKAVNHHSFDSMLFTDSQQMPLKNPASPHKSASNNIGRILPDNQSYTNKNKTKLRKNRKFEINDRILQVSQQQHITEDEKRVNMDVFSTIKSDDSESKMLEAVQQASRILQQSIRQSQDERKLFSKYLDQSNSYLNQLMNQSHDRKFIEKIMDISEIKQQKSDDQLTTQQRWYAKKFNKVHIKSKQKGRRSVLKRSPTSQSSLELSNIKLKYFSQKAIPISQKWKQMSDIIISTMGSTSLPKQIIVLVSKNNKKQQQPIPYLTISREDYSQASCWPTFIPFNQDLVVHINCVIQNGQKSLCGCIGEQQQKTSKCELFDSQGNVQAIMYFKMKKICEIVTQTQQFLHQNVNNENLTNKTKKMQPYKSQEIQEKQIDQQSMKISFARQETPVPNFSSHNKIQSIPRLVEVKIEDTSSLLLHSKSTTPRAKNLEDINAVQAETINIKQDRDEKGMQLNSPVLKSHLGKSDNEDEELATSGIFSGRKKNTVNYVTVDSFQQQNQNSFDNKQKNFRKYTDLNAQKLQQQAQNALFTLQSPKSEQSSRKQKRRRVINEQQKLEVNPQKTQKYQFNRQKLSFSALGIKSIQSEQISNRQNHQKSNKLYESLAINKAYISTGQRRVNLRILNAEVRLRKPSQCGKFLKISVNNEKNPYFTQTSNQLYFLNWRGKGYLFVNISQYSILTIDLMEQSGNINLDVASCRIHLNLLNCHSIRVKKYEDNLLDLNQHIVGNLILQFQFFQPPQILSQPLQISTSVDKKSFKVSKVFSKLKESNTAQSQKQSINSRPRGLSNLEGKISKINSSRHKSLKGDLKIGKGEKIDIQLHNQILSRLKKSGSNAASIKVRKYRGGNIIIPKAARFKTEPTTREDIGPGLYNLQSQFQ